MKLYSGTVHSAHRFVTQSGDVLFRVGLVIDRDCSEFGKDTATIFTKSCPHDGDVFSVAQIGGKWKRVEV